MKGFIMNEGKIIKILEDVIKIDKTEKTITFNHGTSKLQNVDFEKLDLVIVDNQTDLNVGDAIPIDIDNKIDQIIFKSDRELIEQLQQENANLMFQLVLGGVI